jgi:hypothetical protein
VVRGPWDHLAHLEIPGAFHKSGICALGLGRRGRASAGDGQGSLKNALCLIALITTGLVSFEGAGARVSRSSAQANNLAPAARMLCRPTLTSAVSNGPVPLFHREFGA